MVLLTTDTLVRQALRLLDAAGDGASPATCHLQAALDTLSPSDEVFDVDAVAHVLLGLADDQRVRCFVVG